MEWKKIVAHIIIIIYSTWHSGTDGLRPKGNANGQWQRQLNRSSTHKARSALVCVSGGVAWRLKGRKLLLGDIIVLVQKLSR